MTTDAAESLAHADALTAKVRRSARWYGRYLLAYALGAFVLCLLFGLAPVKIAIAVGMPLWMMFIVALSVYSARSRTAMRGLGNIHAGVIGSWTVLWGITIILGSTHFQDWLPWWILGGTACALPGLIGAVAVFRRLRA